MSIDATQEIEKQCWCFGRHEQRADFPQTSYCPKTLNLQEKDSYLNYHILNYIYMYVYICFQNLDLCKYLSSPNPSIMGSLGKVFQDWNLLHADPKDRFLTTDTFFFLNEVMDFPFVCVFRVLFQKIKPLPINNYCSSLGMRRFLKNH